MKKSAVRILSMLLTLVMLFSSAALPYAFAEQVLITEKTPLLDENGALTKPGYCFNNMYEYDRSAIKANPTRIKEWDFYQISNGRYCIQFTIADISLGGACTVGLFDMQTGKRYDALSLSLLTFGRMGLNSDAMTPQHYSRHLFGFDLDVRVTDTKRTISFSGYAGLEPFKAELSMEMFPNHESLVMAVYARLKEGSFIASLYTLSNSLRAGISVSATYCPP